LIGKLTSLGIEELLVQIKAIDGKNGIALTEYTDSDTMTVHWIWFPITHLCSLERSVPPKVVGFLPSTLSRTFNNTIKETIVIYARQTLNQFFESFHKANVQALKGNPSSVFKKPSESLQLHDIISWAVWNEFSDSPATGWMSEISQAMNIQHKNLSATQKQPSTSSLPTIDTHVSVHGTEQTIDTTKGVAEEPAEEKKAEDEEARGDYTAQTNGPLIQALQNEIEAMAMEKLQTLNDVRKQSGKAQEDEKKDSLT
jgi:hypothetical protein